MTLLPYLQIILAVLLVAAILIQRSEASTGGIFGGTDNWNAAYHTRRGFEKVLFNATIIMGVLFAVISFLALILK
jgi:protein translocase SecG subunit